FESASQFSIVVRATDSGGNTFDKSFSITVTDVNEAPTNISLTPSTATENSALGTVVGTLSGSDPDAGDTMTFTLLAGGNLFALVGSEIRVAGAIDYEAAAFQSITIRATDASGLTFDKSLTISVSNVNEAPTNILLSNFSVAENSSIGALVSTLTGVDP